MRIKCGGLAKPRSYLLEVRVLSSRNKVQKGSERGGLRGIVAQVHVRLGPMSERCNYYLVVAVSCIVF